MSDQTGWQIESKMKSVEGPILVLGASGFVGANLFLALLKVRSDVYGTASRVPAWRLDGVPFDSLLVIDLLIESAVEKVLEKIRPKTVFDCTAFGAYSFEQDPKLIYDTNFVRLTQLIPMLTRQGISRYIHSGSSSEYGLNCAGPAESDELLPNSDYAVSKVAAAAYLCYQGRVLGFPCVSLRLYSLYGPLEDTSRLIPAVVQCAREGRLPEFVDGGNSRDFVYVDDAVNAFIRAATELKPHLYGHSINIGTGRKCTMLELATVAKQVFRLDADARFTHTGRNWDAPNWFANPDFAREQIGWAASIGLEEGLKRTFEWIQTIDSARYFKSSKKNEFKE